MKINIIVIFLSAWACIKLPQEMIEWQFLGARFMFARLILTITLALIIGLTMEKTIDQKNHSTKKSKRNGS